MLQESAPVHWKELSFQAAVPANSSGTPYIAAWKGIYSGTLEPENTCCGRQTVILELAVKYVE